MDLDELKALDERVELARQAASNTRSELQSHTLDMLVAWIEGLEKRVAVMEERGGWSNMQAESERNNQTKQVSKQLTLPVEQTW